MQRHFIHHQGPLVWYGIILIPGWRSNHMSNMSSKMRSRITYPSPNVYSWSSGMDKSFHSTIYDWCNIQCVCSSHFRFSYTRLPFMSVFADLLITELGHFIDVDGWFDWCHYIFAAYLYDYSIVQARWLWTAFGKMMWWKSMWKHCQLFRSLFIPQPCFISCIRHFTIVGWIAGYYSTSG